MNSGFLLSAAIAALGLAASLIWALRGSSRRPDHKLGLKVFESAPRHIHHMSQIRRAMDQEDLRYLSDRGGKPLAARVRSERRRIALMYLSAMQRDFDQALHVARVVAVLSPRVSGPQEYERLKLTLLFRFRYQLVRISLYAGSLALPQLSSLGQILTSLTTELEASITALGEQSALAAEIAIQSER